VLEQAAPGRFAATPAGAGREAVDGHGAGPDDEPVDDGVIALAGEPGEQVADGQASRPQLVDAAPSGLDVEVAHDPLERRQGPGVGQHPAHRLARHELTFADDQPRARGVLDAARRGEVACDSRR
jgi:hypothetical protein